MKDVISSNHTKGEQIKTAEEVYDLALKGKGIYCSVWKRISPAAFLVCWQTHMLINFIKKGYLFNITPIQKKADKKLWYQSTKVKP